MRRLLIIALIGASVWGGVSHWRSRAVVQGPGILAAEAPRQVNLKAGTELRKNETTLTTRARFELTARVLASKNYARAKDGDLAPIDLALGWGRMSDSSVLADIRISQSGRYYQWRVDDFPIPRREIETSSANMHMIPADDDIRRQLDAVRPGQVVQIEGFLVDARRAGGWTWKTSMTRADTGGGACELIYVESVAVTE